jgi:5'-nucleotidase
MVLSLFLRRSMTVGSALVATALLGACANLPVTDAARAAARPSAEAAATTDLSIFSINDFHGHIQPKSPVPIMNRMADPATGAIKPQAAGGAAYLATVLQGLRAQRPASLFVAGGDLIGASPQLSSMLADEPTLSALSAMGLDASALGNHELDAGLRELVRKTRGECPSQGCLWPEFKGAAFPYLAANMLDAETGKTILPTHKIVTVGGLKVALVGAVTRDTPQVVVAKSIRGLRFTDEADALNALIPQLRQQGAQLLVAIMHEGAVIENLPNDPSYACAGLRGRGVDVAQRLDAAYGIIISGHTHNAHTCKINGRLLVQAGSFGGWVTESRLKVSATGQVLDAQAVNHPVLQDGTAPNPVFVALVQRAADLTNAVRNRPIATLRTGAQRTVVAPFGDSTLGNLITDAQLAYARKQGHADVAMLNAGGIRADLTVEPGKPVVMGDLFAIQPFNNELIAMTLTGAQLTEVVRRQLPKTLAPKRFAQVSHNFRFQWSQSPDGSSRLDSLTLDGKPLVETKDYRVVVNNFMAEGGDELSVFRQGRDKVNLGVDLEALVQWVADNPTAVDQIQPGRIVRAETK